MYRIIFDTTHSKFVVQLMILGMFWRTSCESGKVKYFETYGDAVKWSRDIGLDLAYHRQATQKDYFAQGVVRNA